MEVDQAIHELETASMAGELSTVQRRFEELRGVAPNTDWLRFPGSSLLIAVEHRHKDVVEYLLSQGVLMNGDHVQVAILHSDEAMLELFIEFGYDIHTPTDWASPPPLALAVHDADLVAWFLSHGADPNAGCPDFGFDFDLTPLSYAVEHGPFEVIKMMFDHGGSVHTGELVYYALRRNEPDQMEVLTYLLDKGASINDARHVIDVSESTGVLPARARL